MYEMTTLMISQASGTRWAGMGGNEPSLEGKKREKKIPSHRANGAPSHIIFGGGIDVWITWSNEKRRID